MADVNLYHHKQTNTWWTNSDLEGVNLTNYINENPIGIGHVDINTDDKLQIKRVANINEIDSMFIPQHVKSFYNVAQDIEEDGLKNAKKVSKRQLKKLLK